MKCCLSVFLSRKEWEIYSWIPTAQPSLIRLPSELMCRLLRFGKYHICVADISVACSRFEVFRGFSSCGCGLLCQIREHCKLCSCCVFVVSSLGMWRLAWLWWLLFACCCWQCSQIHVFWIRMLPPPVTILMILFLTRIQPTEGPIGRQFTTHLLPNPTQKRAA